MEAAGFWFLLLAFSSSEVESLDCEKYSQSYEVDKSHTYVIIEGLLDDLLNCTEQEPKLDIDGFNFKTTRKTIHKMTGLMLAAANGCDDQVSAFIAHKADVNVKNNKNSTALVYATKGNHSEAVSNLLKHKADANIPDMYGVTALQWAVRKGYKEIVNYLLKDGTTDLNIKDNDGLTALHSAAGYRENEIAITLLEKNEDANVQDNEGRTALHWATSSGNDETVETLLKYGVDANIQEDEHGDTALHLAAIDGNYKIVKALLKYGADTNIKTNDGNTPIKMALKHDHDDIFDLFVKDMSKCNA